MSDEPRTPGRSQMDRAMQQYMEAIGRAFAGYLERIGPALRQLAELASRPEVCEAIERAQVRHEAGAGNPCYCLCSHRHPADKGVCDGEGVITREFPSAVFGPVQVPLCAPCAVAQGVTELAAPNA